MKILRFSYKEYSPPLNQPQKRHIELNVIQLTFLYNNRKNVNCKNTKIFLISRNDAF